MRLKSLANLESNPKLIIQGIFACYNLLVMNLVQKNFALRKKSTPERSLEKPRKKQSQMNSEKSTKYSPRINVKLTMLT